MNVKKVRIALIQMKMAKLPAENLDRAARAVERAARNKAKIICLPELFMTEYFPRTEQKSNFKYAEKLPGPVTRRLSQLAKKHKVVLIIPLFEKRTAGLYHNSAVVIDADGRYLGKYRKMHIPHDPHFYEKYYFAPGDLGFCVFQTRYGKIGILICWDQWYPEAARLTALKGAQIIFYPTAIGWHVSEPKKQAALQRKAWQNTQVSHAVTNGIFIASVNRTGQEKSLTFWGSSFVAGPDGEVMAEASMKREEIVYATCDLSRIGRIRQEWPFLRDRRVDAYKQLTSRYLAEA